MEGVVLCAKHRQVHLQVVPPPAQVTKSRTGGSGVWCMCILGRGCLHGCYVLEICKHKQLRAQVISACTGDKAHSGREQGGVIVLCAKNRCICKWFQCVHR
jgi:hypothetical protein